MKLLSAFLFFCLLTMPLLANAPAEPEMAEALRSSGKIYVVVLVIALVFVGLGIYLFRLDRKVSKLEKESQSDKS